MIVIGNSCLFFLWSAKIVKKSEKWMKKDGKK